MTIAIGYEFLGILLLLIYSSGIAIIFVIASMLIGTKHIKVLLKSDINIKEDNEDIDTPYDDTIMVSSSRLKYEVYGMFMIVYLFFIFTFPFDVSFNFSNLLIQKSLENYLIFNTLTYLNDVLTIGFMIYQQFFFYTILSAFLLLTSLISSIYISQSSK